MAPRAERDRGVVGAVEMLYLLLFGLAAILFIGYLGRLHAAGVQVAHASQAAARLASQAPSSAAAESAARGAVEESSLASRCDGALATSMSWIPSASGTWRGGSVTVEISCTVDNGELAGLWAPGSRTIAASDTQPVDRYQR